MAKSGDSFFMSLTLGLLLITLGSCRILLMKFSATEDGRYLYLPVTVNVCAETIKLLVCATLALPVIVSHGQGWQKMFCMSSADVVQLIKWSVPGFLYFCDNLLAFYVIKSLPPALVVLLGNFVIITTSVLYRIILKRHLSKVQWAALIILFLAIVSLSSQPTTTLITDHHKGHAINHLVSLDNLTVLTHTHFHDVCQPEETQYRTQNITSLSQDILESFQSVPIAKRTFLQFSINEGHIMIIVQCFISSLANVYNEKIFKEGNGIKESIYIQNSKLYFFGALFNVLSLVIHGVYRQKLFVCGFFYGHNAYSLVLIFITALYGLCVAFILKFRDNMFHILTSQIITIVVISASIYFFTFRPQLEFFLTTPIVLTAIYIFHTSRAKNSVDAASLHGGGRRIHPRIDNHDFAEVQELVISPDNLRE